jgi:hypothetical protein
MISTAPMPPTMRVFERGWLSSNNVLLFDDRHSATLVDSGYVAHNRRHSNWCGMRSVAGD